MGLMYKGKEDETLREVMELRSITASALQSEVIRSFKRLVRHLNKVAPDEVIQYGIMAMVVIDQHTSVLQYFNLLVREEEGLMSLIASSRDPAFSESKKNGFPRAFVPKNMVVIAQWRVPTKETAATMDIIPPTEAEMLTMIHTMQKEHLLDNMTLSDAYHIALQEALLEAGKIADEEAAAAEAAIAEQQTKGEVIPMTQTNQAPEANDPQYLHADVVDAMLAAKEEEVLQRFVKLMAEKDIAQPQAAVEPEPQGDAVELHYGTKAEAEPVKRLSRTQRLLEAASSRHAAAQAVRFGTAATSTSVRTATDLVTKGITFLGHGTAKMIDKGGNWVADKVEGKKKEDNDTTVGL
jgi:hypothetical protein